MVNVPEKHLHISAASEIYNLSSMCPVIDMAYIFWCRFASSESTWIFNNDVEVDASGEEC